MTLDTEVIYQAMVDTGDDTEIEDFGKCDTVILNGVKYKKVEDEHELL